jgi:predicted secreted hydrolase
MRYLRPFFRALENAPQHRSGGAPATRASTEPSGSAAGRISNSGKSTAFRQSPAAEPLGSALARLPWSPRIIPLTCSKPCPHRSRLSLLLILSLFYPCLGATSADDGFQQALKPREWSFPRDHGRHDGFRTEWWYFTGNLSTADHRPFGFELTFFRTSVAPSAPRRASHWAATDLYFAHAHVADIQSQRYVFADESSRAREGLAMASDRGLDVVLLDWSARQSDDGVIHLRAIGEDCAISLDCAIERGPIFQGPGGLSGKGREIGQASYYYSLTRLLTKGTLTVSGQSYAVEGLSWMDHEFSSNQLSKDQVGWDWMCLQLDNGTDLMIYRMRDAAGKSDFAFATEVTPDGQTRYIAGKDIDLQGSEPWKSPTSGGVYPQQWKVKIAGLEPMMVKTRFEDQELRPARSPNVIYYEGAAEALDAQGRRIGVGYLEMTGYAKSLGGSF